MNTVVNLTAVAYRTIIRPIFFAQNPETVHQRVTNFGAQLSKRPLARKAVGQIFSQRDTRLKKTVVGITFPSPIGLAAGFDYRAQLPWALDSLGFGFATVGTITKQPCPGNPRPWLKRLVKSRSLLVNKGFKNDGITATLPRLQKLPPHMPVGLSLGQTNISAIATVDQAIADIVAAFHYAESHSHQCSYYELNISCPNIQKHISFYDRDNLRRLLGELAKLAIGRPVFIKCPISVADDQLLDIAEIANEFAYIKGLIIGNLQSNRQHPQLLKEEVATCGPGNFSGRPTRERSTELIKLIRKTYGQRFAIIGCGGVFTLADVQEKLAAGADLIQLITGLIFEGPQLVSQFNQQLLTLITNNQVVKK